MKRWLATLLATTGLAGVPQVRADVIQESMNGQFSGSLATPTLLVGPSVTVYADVASGSGIQYFQVTDPQYTQFTLTLIASRVGVSNASSEGSSTYIGLDQIGVSSPASSEGMSTIIGLTDFGGSALVTSGVAASSSGAATTLTLSTTSTGAQSEGYTIPTAALDPIISFYNPLSSAILGTVEITNGNSVVVDGTYNAATELVFGVSFPFDYEVEIAGVSAAPSTSSAVPEPASAAMLGLGAAGAALTRRRKRVI